MIRITGIGDHNRAKWLIRISEVRSESAITVPAKTSLRSKPVFERRDLPPRFAHLTFEP